MTSWATSGTWSAAMARSSPMVVVNRLHSRPMTMVRTASYSKRPMRQGADGASLVQVTAINVPPTAILGNGGAVAEGSSGSVSFTNQADAPLDLASLHYAYDFNNDGVFDLGDGTYTGSGGMRHGHSARELFPGRSGHTYREGAASSTRTAASPTTRRLLASPTCRRRPTSRERRRVARKARRLPSAAV